MSLKAVRGVIFCLVAYLPVVIGTIFTMLPFLPLVLLPPIIRPTVFRRIVDTLAWWWQSLLVGLMDHVAGIKCVITGDPIRPKDHCLYLMNHRTRLDWMFFWQCLSKLNALRHERVILKSGLKHIPGAGWSMQLGLYLFVQRKWEVDKSVFTKYLNHCRDVGKTTQLLLFPEGTDLTANTKSRSDAFAEKNGLPKYDYVLHPRTTGLTFLIQHMRKNKTLDSIYDVTIGYPVNTPKNELSLPLGDFPKEVHYHIRRYPIDELPETEEGLVDWCQDIWRQKETKLKNFYEDKSFDDKVIGTSATGRAAPLASLLSLSLNVIFDIWLMVTFSFARWYFIFAIVFMVFIEMTFGGLDNFQIDIYNKLFQPARNA